MKFCDEKMRSETGVEMTVGVCIYYIGTRDNGRFELFGRYYRIIEGGVTLMKMRGADYYLDTRVAPVGVFMEHPA